MASPSPNSLPSPSQYFSTTVAQELHDSKLIIFIERYYHREFSKLEQRHCNLNESLFIISVMRNNLVL